MTKLTLPLLAATAILSSGNALAFDTAGASVEAPCSRVEHSSQRGLALSKPVHKSSGNALGWKSPVRYADAENAGILYSCSFDFLTEGSESEPAAIELDDWDNISEELIGEENYGFGGQGIMQAGGALYIPFEYNADPDSPYPWYMEGLLWTPDVYEPLQITVDLDVKIAEGCSITSDDLWVYATDYVNILDSNSGEIDTEWSHLSLNINATDFEAESDDDSYYFTIFAEGGADIVIKNIVIRDSNASAGIDAVAVGEGAAEDIYYILEGLRISNVPKGTPVIKVSGSKVSKVIF